ncbi:hypothetical protein C6N75_05635 [Streptomyces solincola]|uniref:Immunity protein 10 of polymorphic toxin system n=1 Tax=Streptomyces solincola TaxID=2100817 RepID=A0A2S9Q0K4_9ACTN|nr:Imm10 family immunity protein [Streptomyces solincola]PRH80201.1 hypothetical protein C6N75_05635 [Streptomyces solincola]
MRLTATEIGFFEDYDDEETLEVAVAGATESGEDMSLSIQRSTYDPDEQEIEAGLDSYNISTERGFTAYGCLRSVQLTDALLTLEFTEEGAGALEVPSGVAVHLEGVDVDRAVLAARLREILDWGASEKRPHLGGSALADPGTDS